MKLWSMLVSLALCASAAWAQADPPEGPGARGGMPPCPRMGGMDGGMRGMGGRMGGGMGAAAIPTVPPLAALLLIHRQVLNLTDQQVDRLRDIQVNMMKDEIRRAADARIAMLDLMQLLRQPSPDRGKVEAAIRDIGRQYTEMQVVRMRAMLDARSVLTEQQRLQIERLMGAPGMRPGAMRGGAPGCDER